MTRHSLPAFSRGAIVALAGWRLSPCYDGAVRTTAPVSLNSAVLRSTADAYAARSGSKLLNGIGSIPGSTNVSVLSYNGDVDVNVSASAVIGPEGGVLSLPRPASG